MPGSDNFLSNYDDKIYELFGNQEEQSVSKNIQNKNNNFAILLSPKQRDSFNVPNNLKVP